MKFVSYKYKDKASYGIFENGKIIDLSKKMGRVYPDLKSLIDASNLDGARSLSEIVEPFLNKGFDFYEKEVTYLPVIPNPNKILCVGMNYQTKRDEFNENTPAPTIFIRFADSQTGHEDYVIKPKFTQQFDYEGELAVVIGKPCYRVSADKALDYVAGYTCYMDGSVRDWQHTWFTSGKNWTQTGAIGPYLVTKDEIPDPQKLVIKTYLNKVELQNESTENMIYSVAKLIEYISTFTKLGPGDIILTGSPGGVGKSRTPQIFMFEGDLIEVNIDKIGTLKNTILEEHEYNIQAG